MVRFGPESGPSARGEIARLGPPPVPAVPELAAFQLDAVHHASQLNRHVHPGAMEVCYILQGAVTWFVDDREFDVHGGQVFCTWPDEPHGGIDGVWHPSRLYWLILRLPTNCPAAYLGLPSGEGQALHKGLWDLRRRTFNGTPELATRFATLHACCQQRSSFQAPAARAALISLLVHLCMHGGGEDRPLAAGPVRQALALMREHIETPLDMAALAGRVGLSTAHFHRLFKEQTGLSPGDYYLRVRLNAARRLLRDTRLTIVDVAMRCGFHSSQYFATCMKRLTGRTPSSFRAASRP